MARDISVYFHLFVFALLFGYVSSSSCQLKQIKADVAFILDSSSSLNDSDFQIMMTFIENFIDSVTIGRNDVRIATAIYAFFVTPKFKFDDNLDEATLKNNIQNIQRSYGGTYTHLGLHWVLQQFTNKTFNARKSTRHLGILITDGHSIHANVTKAAAQLLRNENIEMIAIGVTNDVKKEELSAIASGNDNVFILDNFSELLSVQPCFHSRICQAIKNNNSSKQPWTAASCKKTISTNYSGTINHSLTSLPTLTSQQMTKTSSTSALTVSQAVKTMPGLNHNPIHTAPFTSVSQVVKTMPGLNQNPVHTARFTSVPQAVKTMPGLNHNPVHTARFTSVPQAVKTMPGLNHNPVHVHTAPFTSVSTASQTKNTGRTSKIKRLNGLPLTTNPRTKHTSTIYPGQYTQRTVNSSKLSNYPKLWHIAALAAASLTFIGAVFCLCYCCCFNRFACKRDQTDVLIIDEAGTNGDEVPTKNPKYSGSRRVSSTSIVPFVSKAKPLPMSDGNAFIF